MEEQGSIIDINAICTIGNYVYDCVYIYQPGIVIIIEIDEYLPQAQNRSPKTSTFMNLKADIVQTGSADQKEMIDHSCEVISPLKRPFTGGEKQMVHKHEKILIVINNSENCKLKPAINIISQSLVWQNFKFTNTMFW